MSHPKKARLPGYSCSNEAGEIAPTVEGNGRRQGRQRAKFFDDARGSPGHRVFVIFASFCADPLSSNGRKIFAHKIPKFSKGLRTEFSGNLTLFRRWRNGLLALRICSLERLARRSGPPSVIDDWSSS